MPLSRAKLTFGGQSCFLKIKIGYALASLTENHLRSRLLWWYTDIHYWKYDRHLKCMENRSVEW